MRSNRKVWGTQKSYNKSDVISVEIVFDIRFKGSEMADKLTVSDIVFVF